MSGSAHTPAVSVSHPMISDERLENATGRSRRHWYRELDEVGAQEWDRKRIARWLGVKREVDACDRLRARPWAARRRAGPGRRAPSVRHEDGPMPSTGRLAVDRRR